MLTQQQEPSKAYVLAGIFTLSLRLIVGWTYFSAFWRRLVLENKLIPDATGYIGEKFNHFLPNSIGIKPIIEYLVSTPDLLWWAMVIFTLVEGIVGLLYMLGFFTRLMSIGVFSLAFGILFRLRLAGHYLPRRMANRHLGSVSRIHYFSCPVVENILWIICYYQNFPRTNGLYGLLPVNFHYLSSNSVKSQ